MSADLLSESLLSLPEAARQLPSRPHHSTVWRWAEKGINGVMLETLRIGTRRFTSTEALQRFLEAINEPAAPAPRPRTRRETAAAVARAERILKRAGV